MKPRDWLGLFVALAACYGAAAIGAQFTPGDWYADLAKPSWNPPSWLFAPVWTALYGMMAVAAWLVWRSSAAVRTALALFAFQLMLNAAWSWLFFGLKRPDLAFADIVLVWFAILATTAAFFRIRTAAGILMLPYLFWVSFATALNYAIWRLN
ncbi:tryptophan-rich sensory protein [soil metagenome]